MQAYRFREEDRPKFSLTISGSLALLLFLLFMLTIGQKINPFQLNAEEKQQLEALKAIKEEKQRELVFRFSDEPEDQVDNSDAKYLSDVNHLKRTTDVKDAPNENEDPFSKGNSYEMKNEGAPTPSQQPAMQPNQVASQAQQANPATKPQELTQPQPKEVPPVETKPEEDKPAKEMKATLPDEPIAAAEADAEDKRDLDADEDSPLAAGAPKPYRPLTKSEQEQARQAAIQQMNIQEAARPGQVGSSGDTFDNPTGSTSQFRGFSMEASRSDLGDYMKVLKQLVESNWRLPNIARLEVSGVTGISFNIHKDGSFSDVQIIHQSGTEPLDVSSLNAIRNTHPAPPLPSHVDEEFVSIKFGFYYNMRPRY